MSQCKLLGDHISKLVSAVNNFSKNTNDDSEQLNLVQCSQQFIAVSIPPDLCTFPVFILKLHLPSSRLQGVSQPPNKPSRT